MKEVTKCKGSNLPLKLAKPVRRSLEGAGYLRLEQIALKSDADLLQLHIMGPKAIKAA
jgi:hypothetical protein